MKFLIEKNVIVPISKVTKEIEERSIKYSWFTHEWDEIDVYDLENWKLAPIVRYLIEGDDNKKSFWLIWFVLIWLIWFAIVLIILFSWNNDVPKEVKTETKEITKVVDLQTTDKKETETKTNQTNELMNEINMMSSLKDEAELKALKSNFEIEKRNIQIENLENEKLNLTNEIQRLKNIIATHTDRVINGPTDEFIYYLGDVTYKKCETTLNEQIKANCKDLYFNYLEYAKNSKQNWLYTNTSEVKLNSK